MYIVYVSVAEMASAEHHKGSHNKTIISVIVASTALGLIILSVICLRIYRKRNTPKSQKDNSHSSGICLSSEFRSIWNFRMC